MAMKIPPVDSRLNKIRDGAICKAWAIDGLSCEQIAPRFKLTASRIQQIVYKNRALVTIDKEWERVKRLRILDKELKRKDKSNKDLLDVVEQHRKETNGETPMIDQRTFVQNVNYGWQSDDKENHNSVLSTELPEGNSRIPVAIQSSEDRTPRREDGTTD
jgi:hypothetical protein